MAKDVTAEETTLSKITSKKVIGLCLILLVFVTAAIHSSGWKSEKLIVLRRIRGEGFRFSIENSTEPERSSTFEETPRLILLCKRTGLLYPADGTNTLVIVHTQPNNTDLRYAIRSTWGNATYLNPRSIKVYFLIENQKNFTLEDVKEEYEAYKDMVLADITDSLNLCSSEYLAVFREMSQSCLTSLSYIIKTEDNVYLNLPYIYDFLKSFKTRLMMGCLYSSGNIRWTGEEEENFVFDENHVEYLIGSTYVMSVDVVKDLCWASRKISVESFLKSNRFITRILPEKANVTLTNHQMFTYIENVTDACVLARIAVSHKLVPSTILKAHKEILKTSPMDCSGTIIIASKDEVYFSYVKLDGPDNPYGPSIIIRNKI